VGRYKGGEKEGKIQRGTDIGKKTEGNMQERERRRRGRVSRKERGEGDTDERHMRRNILEAKEGDI
jgi:hypothetical protein